MCRYKMFEGIYGAFMSGMLRWIEQIWRYGRKGNLGEKYKKFFREYERFDKEKS